MAMKQTLARRIAAAACALAASGAGAAEAPFDYYGAITMAATGGEAIQRLELPVTVYAGIQHADLRDLRVFNAAQEPVPFALAGEVPPAAAAGPTFNPPLFPIREDPARKSDDRLSVRVEQRPDGSVISIQSQGPGAAASGRKVLAYLVDAAKIDSMLVRVRPQWAQAPENYIGAARIEASDDLKNWRVLTGNAPLAFLAQGQAKLVQDAIEFPATKSRYYRLSFTPAAPELAGLLAEAPSPRPEPPRVTLRVTGKPGEKPGEVVFDAGVRAPVDEVRLIVGQQNALAPVRIETRADERAEWRAVASTVAYRMVRDGVELTSPPVHVASNAAPQWRLVVDQAGGGLGAALPELELSWPARNLVFVARGQGPFTLAFGKRDAAAAALPLATVIPGYREGGEATLPLAVISEVKLRAVPPPPMMTRIVGDTEPRKLWLWAALIAGVLVLAGMAWRLSRQLKRSAPAGKP